MEGRRGGGVEGWKGHEGASDLHPLERLHCQRPLIAHVTVALASLSLVAVAWVGERRAGRRPRRRVLPLQGQPCRPRESTPLPVQPLSVLVHVLHGLEDRLDLWILSLILDSMAMAMAMAMASSARTRTHTRSA